MKRLLLVTVFCFFIVYSFAQTGKIDSLKNNITHANNKAEKLKAVFAICEAFYSLNTDTFYHYALLSKQLASSQQRVMDEKQADYYLANALVQKGLNDQSLLLIDGDVQWLKENNKLDSHLQNQFTLLKARALTRSNRYEDALSILFELLQRVENSKDTILQVRTLTNIGWVKMEMQQNREAIKWFRKAINESPSPSMPQLGIVYSDIASAYSNLPMVDSAFFFIKKSIRISIETQALSNLANAYFIEGYTYKDTKQYNLAEKDFSMAVAIRKKIGDMFFMVSDMAEFSDFYAQTNQPRKGILLAQQAIDSVNKYKITAKLLLVYTELSENYRVGKDFFNYSKTLGKIISIKDSMYQKNSADALAKLETKYEVQKKEATIARQKLALTKDSYLFWGSALFLLLGGAIIWLIFRDFRRKQKLKLQQLHDEEKRLSEQAVADAEESERRRIAADLHDNLGAQLSFIKRNVNFIMDQPAGLSHEDERKYLSSVNDTAQNAMIDLRETIWVLNKDEVNIQEFADKLKSYLMQQLMGRDMIKWNFRENIYQDWKLSSGEIMHIFRIVQELISNVIKHSGADKLNITLNSAHPGNYELEIQDNGKGFNVYSMNEGHYGLENIERRAKEISAVFSVTSSADMGTHVVLRKDKE